MISSLVDAVLHALDDAITPAAYWVLELGIPRKSFNKRATEEIVSADKIHTFQEAVGTPFVALLNKRATEEIVMQTRSTHSRKQ